MDLGHLEQGSFILTHSCGRLHIKRSLQRKARDPSLANHEPNPCCPFLRTPQQAGPSLSSVIGRRSQSPAALDRLTSRAQPRTSIDPIDPSSAPFARQLNRLLQRSAAFAATIARRARICFYPCVRLAEASSTATQPCRPRLQRFARSARPRRHTTANLRSRRSLRLPLRQPLSACLLGVYGPNNPRERSLLWDEFDELRRKCIPNWVMGGDFNTIRWTSEKVSPFKQVRITRSMRLFNQFIQAAGLNDVPLTNGSYSWSNHRSTPTLSLIDRFLITDSIQVKFNTITSRRLERICFDHFPIGLTLGKISWGPTPFRFINAWLRHKTLIPLIEKWWSENQIEGWPGHSFIQKLKNLKPILKDWNINTYGHHKARSHQLRNDIDSIDAKELSGSLTIEDIENRLALKAKLMLNAAREEIHWRQACKNLWLKEGDENTSFFHKMASANRKRNFIHEILSSSQQCLLNDKDIEVEFIEFFKKLYNKKNYSRSLPSIAD